MLRINLESISVTSKYSEKEYYYFIPSDIYSTIISSLQTCEGKHEMSKNNSESYLS